MTRDKKYKQFREAFNLLAREPLSKHTSFRVGGPADLLALPRDRQTLTALLTAAKKESLPFTIIGGGTNTLVSDKGVRGLVIILKALKSSPRILENNKTKKSEYNKETIYADGGERLSTVCKFAMEQGLSGLEFAAGIPGTLGGAIMMNAGTTAWDISQVIATIDIIDSKTLTYQTIARKDLSFSYRQLCLPDKIIIGAHLTLTKADPAGIKKAFAQSLKSKNTSQPVSLASAGCFFKNPSVHTPAGKLIEEAGLKGKQINGAQISNIHANFIVNTNNARCEDILALKKLVQKTVFEKYRIKLETEVKVTGE
ncbi:MAG: UDP-N-acetylmuramate dehydrogenase [Desulfobacteraceae bacterium]|nr:UDP-N-acetylmuramate dehydrogenase [Desulfobacteraceae bacterium]